MATPVTIEDEWTKRSVVSSFILKRDGDTEPRVALFQRSEKVSTYRHHLAPISGSIDRSDSSALAAAWREIAEETTLTPASLVFLRHGKPYTFRDASVRREWTVYPFLFRLRNSNDEEQIQTDWEHEGWSWHDPDAVIRGADAGGLGSKCVPRLAESLRRVWFETDLGPAAAGALSSGLDALAHDHESGARQLAGVALQTLRDVIGMLDAPAEQPSEEWWLRVRFAAWHLWKNGRESMGAAIMSVLLGALASIEQKMGRSRQPGTWRAVVLEGLDARLASRQEAADMVAQAFADYLERMYPAKLSSHQPIVILTLSESSTIRHALRYAARNAGFVMDVRVLESRPLFEGVSLAASLVDDLTTSPRYYPAAPAHKITLYSDASAALAASGIDVLVLGADRIAASGAVSNKTGSLPAALAAKYVSQTARIVVLGESDKVAPPGRPEDHIVEDNDPSHISRAWPAKYNSPRVRNATTLFQRGDSRSENKGVEIEVRNIFFEWVPASLIDAYVTESGERTAQQIAQQSETLKIEEKRLFGSL